MDKYSKAILADAKEEYTRGLIDLLTETLYKGLQSIYDTARKTSKSNNLNTLKTFQLLLSKTPKWSDDKINKEVSRIKAAADCDYLEDLVTAVFVTHTKILISIKAGAGAAGPAAALAVELLALRAGYRGRGVRGERHGALPAARGGAG